MRALRRPGACLANFLFILAVAFACLNDARAEPPPPVAIGFYMPVLREVSRRDVEISLRFWVEELARSIGLTYKPVQFYDSMADLRRDMLEGRINYLVGTGMGVAQHFHPDELGDGFSGYKQHPEHLLLVARRESGIQSPADLAGKRVGLLDGDELSDAYLEALMLKAWGQPDWTRLGQVSRETRSSKLTHRLFFDQVDAALVYRSGFEAAVALNPQVGQRLRVLESYTLKIRSPHIALFSAQVSPEHRELITQAAFKLNATARGRQVMQIYQADEMVRTRVRELDPFYELQARLRASAKAPSAVGSVKARR